MTKRKRSTPATLRFEARCARQTRKAATPPECPTIPTQQPVAPQAAPPPSEEAMPTQLVHMPAPVPESRAFPAWPTAVAAILLMASSGINVRLLLNNHQTTRSLQALSARIAEQSPTEVPINILASNLKSFEGKRVQIGPLALRSNAAQAAQLTVHSGAPDGNSSIDVFYENALNSPKIRALAPAKDTSVTIVGRCYRYENTPDSWYVEAEAVSPNLSHSRIQ